MTLITLNVTWTIFKDYQNFHGALNKTYVQNFSYYHEIYFQIQSNLNLYNVIK